jgi:hypothetical protein
MTAVAAFAQRLEGRHIVAELRELVARAAVHAVVEAGVLRVWQAEQRGDDVEVPEETVRRVLDAPKTTCGGGVTSTLCGEDVELIGLLYTEGVEAGEVCEPPGPLG